VIRIHFLPISHSIYPYYTGIISCQCFLNASTNLKYLVKNTIRPPIISAFLYLLHIDYCQLIKKITTIPYLFLCRFQLFSCYSLYKILGLCYNSNKKWVQYTLSQYLIGSIEQLFRLKNNSFILRKANYILIILNNMMNLQAHVSMRMIKGAGKIMVTI